MSRFNKIIFHTEGALPHNYVQKERERTVPVAKTRWHPKPDQIQILEAIVNSGMVNPPREEIKRIRGQLEGCQCVLLVPEQKVQRKAKATIAR